MVIEQMVYNKKIGVILDSEPAIGGSFQYALSLTEAVVFAAQKNKAVLCFFVKNVEWSDYIREYGGEIIVLSGKFIDDKYKIDNAKCDLVFATCQSDWASRLSTPTVTPIHDLMHRYENEFPEVADPDEKTFRDRLFHGNMENAIGVLVDSKIGAMQVKETYGRIHEDKLYVLPFAAPGYLQSEAEPIDIPFDKYIFYPAQFWKHKNHINIIRAISKLREEGTIVNCIFVGYPKNGYDDVRNLIDESNLQDQICILGYVKNSQMKTLYQKARALVMASFLGPTNIPPLEAITMGCPVAASRVYAMPDQLGNAALYFDPRDVNEIADVIKQYWNNDNLCREMIKRGTEIAGYYTQNAFNERFGVCFNELLDKANQINENASIFKSFCMAYKDIYIFGAGKVAMQILTELEYLCIKVEGIIVSNKAENSKYSDIFNKDINGIEQVKMSDSTGVICAVMDKGQQAVIKEILEREIPSDHILFVDKNVLEKLTR